MKAEEVDCKYVIDVLKELVDKDIDINHKQHFIILQDMEKVIILLFEVFILFLGNKYNCIIMLSKWHFVMDYWQ